jgi:hypothetical protein
MALTNDNSDRLMHFESGEPIKDVDKYIQLKKMIDPRNYTGIPTHISFEMINQIFSSVKDSFSGITISTSSDQFKLFCQRIGAKVIENHEVGGFVVKPFYIK